ncbi:hypothetical protein LX36DRAFT_455530 [Colletotrichum falcatum]|nr:hypothetical protein LX36DRAFT_455530 [Colletotrichum falcatum]
MPLFTVLRPPCCPNDPFLEGGDTLLSAPTDSFAQAHSSIFLTRLHSPHGLQSRVLLLSSHHSLPLACLITQFSAPRFSDCEVHSCICIPTFALHMSGPFSVYGCGSLTSPPFLRFCLARSKQRLDREFPNSHAQTERYRRTQQPYEENTKLA